MTVLGGMLLGLVAAGAPAAEPQPDLDGYRQTVAPFLEKHCVKCHGPDKPKGKLSFLAIDANVPTGKDIDRWKSVAERLALNEMPPESEPKPDAKVISLVLKWIKAELTKGGESTADAERKLLLPGHGNRVDHEALFTGTITTPSASPPRLWRLSPQVYTTFVPRIAGKFAQVGQPFSVSAAEGFKDYADLFAIDEPTVNQLMRNAGQLVEMECGLVKGSKAVKEFQRLLDPKNPPTADEVKAAVRKQFQMALLREPTAADLNRFQDLMDKNVKDGGPAIGAKTTLATILMLPEAMYRYEIGLGEPDAHGRRMLSPRELAYAVAFALTDAGPDAALLKAVEADKLTTKADVEREVTRLLKDKAVAKPRIMRFFDEYFEYPAAQDVFKDLPRGEFRPEVFINDTRLLIQHVLDQDRDVLKELLTTNKSFVNYKVDAKGVAAPARVANKPTDKPEQRKPEIHHYYNLPDDWAWTAQQPVELPQEERAGVLTQPSWLAAFATNNENHAIRRGKWLRERLLGGVVPDLPISVDAQLPNAPEKTLRQRMEITRQEYCWQCHQKMNGLGLAFESYDYMGRFRKTETVVDLKAPPGKPQGKGQPPEPVFMQTALDTTGLIEHSGDAKLDGPVPDAIAMLHNLAGSDRVRQVFVRHAFRYWMGRNETLADAPTLLAADRAYVEGGGSMRALIASLLTSDSFLYRRSTKSAVPGGVP